MRKLLLLPLAAVFFTSASSPRVDPLTAYVPIMMSRTQLNTSVTGIATQPLKTVGKIYKFNNALFVVEPTKGIHVFDNTNPQSPTASGFIRVPGCVDVAIKNGILYADNATDLVSIDISNPSAIREVGRAQNVFPEMLPPDKKRMPIAYSSQKRPKDLIIVGWELKTEAK